MFPVNIGVLKKTYFEENLQTTSLDNFKMFHLQFITNTVCIRYNIDNIVIC